MTRFPKVIHFSITPLAGSPIRIVNALNSHTAFKARHVVLLPYFYGTRIYETDLVWGKNKSEILEMMRQAEIIHLHHFIHLEKNSFDINFKEMLKKGVRIIRQFHSDPETICRFSGVNPKELLEDPLPQLVISQYHERYFPKARLVPNIVPLYEESYLPQKDSKKEKIIFFAPTSFEPGFSSRWGSKGAVETLEVLSSVAKRTGAGVKFLFVAPHE